MARWSFSRSALIPSVAGALLSGCGASHLPISAPGAMPQSRAIPTSSYEVLHTFTRGPEGKYPLGGLVNVDGTLYGTTYAGGSGCGPAAGCGTLYSISPAGEYKLWYKFKGHSDGARPGATLIDVHGTLYGTTLSGGGSGCLNNEGCGTVFSFSTSGFEKVLYRFAGGTDGAVPEAGLTDVNGTLYGTTSSGGSLNGTVYSMSTAGVEHVLYKFQGGSDGSKPAASLTYLNGTLYGTTSQGGGCSASGCGTVFSMSTSGAERVLYRFAGGSDGLDPMGALIAVKGMLYGTTKGGGTGNCQTLYHTGGCGTAYSISTSGVETVLHSFNYYDGAAPMGALIYVRGKFYGTASKGGDFASGNIYSMTKQGSLAVLHTFTGGSDGRFPETGLIGVQGTFYGTTYGHAKLKAGTVFALTP